MEEPSGWQWLMYLVAVLQLQLDLTEMISRLAS